ncbi:MAG: PspC domain-containing protein [Muribaculaceae bacterium]|nr:PspC domain-containing protein [Muribaculaceae bacterium]
MKKTININLAGMPFTIDEDAYHLLNDYLDTIRYAFDTQEDTGELAADIEARIAEILMEDHRGKVRIVTFEEVSKVIERIGKPSDFIDIKESVEEDKEIQPEVTEVKEEIRIEEPPTTPPPYERTHQYSRNPFVRKRIFRDPQNAMLGGVCSGLAAYLNVDVTIVRLLTVLLFFLSASTVAIVYIILWIVVPPANTPLQRMQMKGENPTMENIAKSVTENYMEESNPNNYDKGFIQNAISIFVKFLVIVGLIIAAPILIVLAATLIGCMIAVFVIGIGIFSGGMFDSFQEGLMVLYILFAVIGGAITLGIPIWLFIRKSWKKNRETYNPVTQRTLLIIWLCGIALVSVFSVKAVKKSQFLEKSWGNYIENVDEVVIDEESTDSISNAHIHIDDNGIKIESTTGESVTINKSGVVIKQKSEENRVISSQDSISSPSPIPNDSLK